LQEFEDQEDTTGQPFHFNRMISPPSTEANILMQTQQEPYTIYNWYEISSDEEEDIISHVIIMHHLF
jgi:hypothetical protein